MSESPSGKWYANPAVISAVAVVVAAIIGGIFTVISVFIGNKNDTAVQPFPPLHVSTTTTVITPAPLQGFPDVSRGNIMKTRVKQGAIEPETSIQLESFAVPSEEGLVEDKAESIEIFQDGPEEGLRSWRVKRDSGYNNSVKLHISDKEHFSGKYAAPGDKIFYEDFSAYGEGELPAGWIGGDNMSVVAVNKKKILKYFSNGSYDITTKKIDLSGNFKATILMKHYFHNQYDKYRDKESSPLYGEERLKGSVVIHFGMYQIWIGDGDLNAGMKGKWANWQDLEAVAPEKTFSVSLEKKGPVCIVYINNAKVFVGRFPEVKMNNIRFTSNSKFEVHSIVVEEL